MHTLNAACSDAGGTLTDQKLDKAFETWWPELERELHELLSQSTDDKAPRPRTSGKAVQATDILEEILETSRNTQRLLGNTDTKLYSSLDKLQEQVAQLLSYGENQRAREVRRLRPNMHPMMFEEMFMMSREDMVDHETGSAVDPAPYFIPMMLSPLRDGMPWLYDAGWQLAVLLMSDSDRETKEQGVGRFRTLVRMLSHGHPMFRELVGNKDEMMAVRELPMLVDEMLSRYFDR